MSQTPVDSVSGPRAAPVSTAIVAAPPSWLPVPHAAGDVASADGGGGRIGSEIGAWIVAWGELVLLAYLAVIGAFFASADASPGDYTCGLILALSAIALAFIRLKSRFDGTAGSWANSLLVDDWANLGAAIVVFVLVGLAGLFVAASYDYGGLHIGGVALFLFSGLAVFLNLKRVFDQAAARH